jgi:hypothetical protein
MKTSTAPYFEAADQGKTWDVVIIRAGASHNGIFYPDAVLSDAAPRFEGVRVYARADDKHLKGAAPDINELVGWISGVKFLPGSAADTGYLMGVLHIAGSVALRDKITDAWQRGNRDFIGLSIAAGGKARAVQGPRSDGAKKIAESIDVVNSVDLIVHPGAGGGLVNLIEAAPTTRANITVEHHTSHVEADQLLDRFFNAERPTSFREAYIAITGDKHVSGRLENCSPIALRESLDTTSWPEALGAAVNRRMVAEYRKGGRYAVWRKLVHVARDINDFRTQQRVRYGGYGDLPIVNQGAAYQALPSPADESASYAVVKRGGTEDITLEMVENDDIQAIRLIPKRMAEAAHRTLAHFALDFLRLNPVIYDGVALFDAAHGNLGNLALSAVGINAGRAAMKKHTELSSGERLNIEPRYLWVPFDLEETGANLFRRGTNNDRTFVQDMNIEVVPVWYWQDENDWCLSADPEATPTIEVGFLNGEEEPALFVQDAPSVGSLFANDKLTLKIRHIYGGAPVDYRGLYKSVVA